MDSRLRPLLQNLTLLLVFLPGCSRTQPEGARACFRELDRSSPGILLLRQPVSCAEAVPRYRLEEGAVSRPQAVRFLESDGRSALSYRVEYDSQGRPRREDRLIDPPASTVRIFGQTGSNEFAGRRSTIRFSTELDDQGRPIQLQKFEGTDRVYRVQRQYLAGELVSEMTYDGSDRLRFGRKVQNEDGRWIERMHDGQGNLLMEREIPEGKRGLAEGVDTPGRGLVQDLGTGFSNRHE